MDMKTMKNNPVKEFFKKKKPKYGIPETTIFIPMPEVKKSKFLGGMEMELKKCPFCGGNAEIFDIEYVNIFAVKCYICGAEGPSSNSKDIAKKKWNRRTK